MTARALIAERLLALSDQMQSVALDLDSILSSRADELRSASLIASHWAAEIITEEQPCLRD